MILRSDDQAGGIGPGSGVALPIRADGQRSELPLAYEGDTAILPRAVPSVASSSEPQNSGPSSSLLLPLLVDTDTVTVVFYINREVAPGVPATSICRETVSLLLWCQWRMILVRVPRRERLAEVVVGGWGGQSSSLSV